MAYMQSHPIERAIKNLLLVLLIVVVSIGGTLLYSAKADLFGIGVGANADGKPKTQAAPVIPGPIYVALDPFTVTLPGNYDRRILYTSITLRVADKDSSKLLENYMPEVRNRVLLTLSEQNPQTVQTPQGRTALAKALTTALEAPYTPHPKGPKISNVLFTAFVVQ